MNLRTFFTNLINSLLDGSFERVRIINEMNRGFQEHFFTGEIDRLCKVSICSGDQDFRHEMSSILFRSGFKISIENDTKIQDSEIIEISQYVLNNNPFIRQLMSMGFDTLIVQGKTTGIGKKFSLKAYSNLQNYFLQ